MDELAFWCTVCQILVSLVRWQLIPFLLTTAIGMLSAKEVKPLLLYLINLLDSCLSQAAKTEKI